MIYAETAVIEWANISSNPMDLEKGFGRESGQAICPSNQLIGAEQEVGELDLMDHYYIAMEQLVGQEKTSQLVGSVATL